MGELSDRINNCKFCGKEIINKRKFCNNDCFKLWSHDGKNNPNFGKKHPGVGKNYRDLSGCNNPNYGKLAWNNGQTKDTDIRIKKYAEKVSIAKMDKPRPDMFGDNNFSRKHPEIIGSTVKASFTSERRQKSADIMHHRWEDPLFRLKVVECNKKYQIRVWEDPEHAKRIFRRRNKSGPEIIFETLAIENHLPYYFNGYAQNKTPLILGRKIPDFVHNTDKKLIEIWGNFYHNDQNPQVLIDHYKKYGYECIVIWASELKDKEKILEKVEFIGVGNHE